MTAHNGDTQKYHAHKVDSVRKIKHPQEWRSSQRSDCTQGAPASDISMEITSFEGSEDHIESCLCNETIAINGNIHVRRPIFSIKQASRSRHMLYGKELQVKE